MKLINPINSFNIAKKVDKVNERQGAWAFWEFLGELWKIERDFCIGKF